MEETIKNILLLRSEILTYSRNNYELKEDRDNIEIFLKILAEYSSYTLDIDYLKKLSTQINLINEEENESKNEEFKKDFLINIKNIISKSGYEISKKEESSNIDLEKRIQDLEKIIKDHNSTITEINDVSNYYENIHENMLSLDQKLEDIEKKEKILSNIKEYADSEITKNNINLLSSGFSSILKTKKSELNSLRDNLILFGLFILGIPFTIILADYYKWKILFYPSSIISILTIELFIIYFFKIFLQNYNELKQQILQIDNKQVLLSFISNYLKFKDSTSITDNSIEKLEEIIFSKISLDTNKSPTAPDIASIIDKIIKAIKGN